MAKLSKKLAVLISMSLSVGTVVANSNVLALANASAPLNLSWFSDVNGWTMGPWNTKPNTVEGTITKKFGLTFNFNVPAQDGDTKLNLMMVAGKLPDIISLQDGPTEQELVKSGKVWNLTELFKKYDPSALKTTFPVDLQKMENTNLGGFYGVPSWATTPTLTKEYPAPAGQPAYSSITDVIINQDLLKKSGLSLSSMRTETGLLAALKKVAAMKLTYKGAPVIPLQIDNGSTVGWFPSSVEFMATMFGAMPIDKARNYRDIILSPEMKQAIDFFWQAAQDGLINQGQMALDPLGNSAVVRSGRVFAFIGNTQHVHPETMWQQNPSETWVSPGVVISSKGYRPVSNGFSYSSGWTQTFVSKTAANPALIAKWLDYMYSPAGQILGNFGLKGIDYTVGKKGLLYQTPYMSHLPSTIWETTGLGGMWYFNQGSILGHYTPPAETESARELTALWSAYPMSKQTYHYDSTALQFPANLIPPNSQLFQQQKQMLSYEQSQVAQMIFASSKAQENQMYNTMISQLHTMGLDQLDKIDNWEFHKLEKQYNEHITGINP